MTLVLGKSLSSNPSAWCGSKAFSLRGFRPNSYPLPGLRTSWPPLRTAVSLITLFVVVYSLSCVRLFCDPMDCSPPESFVHGIFQARILEWVVMPSSRGSSWPVIEPMSHILADRSFIHWATWKLQKEKVVLSWPTLCDPMGCSLSGSSVPGILQAKIL